eukprot:560335-Rhodomonas_salina.2
MIYASNTGLAAHCVDLVNMKPLPLALELVDPNAVHHHDRLGLLQERLPSPQRHGRGPQPLHGYICAWHQLVSARANRCRTVYSAIDCDWVSVPPSSDFSCQAGAGLLHPSVAPSASPPLGNLPPPQPRHQRGFSTPLPSP